MGRSVPSVREIAGPDLEARNPAGHGAAREYGPRAVSRAVTRSGDGRERDENCAAYPFAIVACGRWLLRYSASLS